MTEAEPRRTVNAAQRRRWNGASGAHWIAHRERYLAGHRYLLPHLRAAAEVSSGERVLDVGCGCGATTIAAARDAHPGRCHAPGAVIGLDLSGPMLGVARRLAAQAGVGNIGFVQADAQVCPIRPASFDVVLSSFGVMFFDSPAVAFANIAAAVRPGGRLVFMCWQHDAHNELLSIPVRAFDDSGGRQAADQGNLFADPQRIISLLAVTGWRETRVSAIREPAWIGADLADVMAYIRGMPVIRRLAAGLGSRSESERIFADISAQYAARERPDGVWVDAAAWLVSARREP